MMKMVADLYLATTHFSCTILSQTKVSTVIRAVGMSLKKPPETEKNASDLITLLLDIEPNFSLMSVALLLHH